MRGVPTASILLIAICCLSSISSVDGDLDFLDSFNGSYVSELHPVARKMLKTARKTIGIVSYDTMLTYGGIIFVVFHSLVWLLCNKQFFPRHRPSALNENRKIGNESPLFPEITQDS